jgi:hypothetical protein
MNGTSRMNPDSEPDDELDPALLGLFDRAPSPPDAAAFVNGTLRKLETARRARLIRQCATLLIVLLASAFLAPYAARATLMAASWFADWLPAAGVALLSPIGWICVALVAWRITRRRFS